jgi:hypothetical protein
VPAFVWYEIIQATPLCTYEWLLLLMKLINKVIVPCNYGTLQPDYRRTLPRHKSHNKSWPAVVNPKALLVHSSINRWQETLFSLILPNMKGVRAAGIYLFFLGMQVVNPFARYTKISQFSRKLRQKSKSFV